MIRFSAVILFASAFALLTADRAQAGFLDQDTEGVRADVVYYDDTNDGFGMEIGYGVSLYELDDVGVVYGYAEDEDDNRMRSLYLYAEEHYLTHTPLVPFIGALIGFSWYDSSPSGPGDDDGFMAGVRTGAKLVLHDALALSATLQYAVSIENDPHFLDDDGAADNALSLAFGARWYF